MHKKEIKEEKVEKVIIPVKPVIKKDEIVVSDHIVIK